MNDDATLNTLAESIRTMSVRSKLYKVLKRELSARGWWKNQRRGKPYNFKSDV